MGVQDLTRQRALRCRTPDSQAFLANASQAVPPAEDLRELEALAREVRGAFRHNALLNHHGWIIGVEAH